MDTENKKRSTKQKVMMWVGVSLMVIMLVAVIVLSVYLALEHNHKNNMTRDMENRYQAAYYGLVNDMVNIENDLAKVRVMSSSGILEDTLENIDVNCQLGDVYLSVLTTAEDYMLNLNKYLHQLGGYSHYVAKNIAKGKEMTEDERKVFDDMWRVSKEYGRALDSISEDIAHGKSFVESFASKEQVFGGIFDELDQNMVKYPTLIYDGPFSDGVADRPAKGITGEELSEPECREQIHKYLVGYGIESIVSVTENNNRIPSYIYNVTLSGGRDCTVQISKQGGKLLMMDLYHQVDQPTLTVDKCEQVAEQYCESIGLKNMKAVWINNSNSNVYINMCYEQDGVVLYPDMVKIKISLDTGEVIGYEGLNYAYNHTERKAEELQPKISEEQAVLEVSSILQEIESRLCMIPVNTTSEQLCYEVVGSVGGEQYFVYIDAMTGEEVKVLRMIDSNQGNLLM